MLLSKDKQNFKCLFRRALCYKAMGDFESAVKDLQKVLVIDATHAQARQLLQEL
jgi:tetratricopeptide (TPR) repeat protein